MQMTATIIPAAPGFEVFEVVYDAKSEYQFTLRHPVIAWEVGAGSSTRARLAVGAVNDPVFEGWHSGFALLCPNGQVYDVSGGILISHRF